MLKLALIITFIFFISNNYAIIPPKYGVKPPANFENLKRNIEKYYDVGYYAEKFNARKELNDKISKGLIPKSTLIGDTVFALTILGKYSNSTPIYSTGDFQTKLFDGPNPTGTITQYYQEISYGQLYFGGRCNGWYQVPGTQQSYVGDNSGLGAQGGPRFVLDLLTASDTNINFADYIQYYDDSGNPRIGFIAVVHTGADAAAGANNIWSHRWTFGVITNRQPYTTNDIDPVSGKHVLVDGDYAIQPELEGSNNTSGNLIDIGVFAHEFGHIFGLPDLYDTDNSSEGLGNWCLMAGGSYGGNGSTSETPVHMSAWCKNELGWVSPVEVVSFLKDNVVYNVEENPVVYKIWKMNQSNSLEYFLIENRQKTGFDKNLYKPGLLIYHVDETQNGNQNENHYLVDLEQADGKRNLNLGNNRGDEGDPFPGSTGNIRFDQSTAPGSNSYSLQKTYVSIRNIRLNGLDATADFDIGTSPYIQLKDLSVTEENPLNGRVEPGEIGRITFTLFNIEPTASNQTRFNFSINDPMVDILNSEVLSIVDGEGETIASVSSAISVNPEFKSKMVCLNYEVESEGNRFIDSMNVPLGIPKILIVSKAEKEGLIDYYDSSLTNMGFNFEEAINSIPQFVSERDAVIYLTGQSLDNLFTTSEIDSLSAYIDNGGNIFFSGQNIAEYLKDNYTSFLTDRIGINWIKNNGPLIRKVYGLPNDPFGSQIPSIYFSGNNGARNERIPDVISSNGNFNISFSFKTDLSDGAGGWIEKSSGAKIFFLGFGFESINNIESSRTRDEIMTSILNWFGVSTLIADENNVVVNDFHLFQNYPNPFNPSTTIEFALPVTAKIQVKVFNMLGQTVKVIYDGVKDAGYHKLNWKSDDINGNSVSSGIYFYELKVSGFDGNVFNQMKKMILIK